MIQQVSNRTIGINFKEGKAAAVLWAPLATSATLIIHEKLELALEKQDHGYWSLTTNEIQPGERYWFAIDGGEGYPDPASLAQPNGVHGPSTALDLRAYAWSDASWQNIPLDQFVIYELHTGTFSDSHNFDGIAARLDHLVNLGITAIEIMPVAQFPGNRNWGYDGVFAFAVQDSYGGAEGLQRLVDACHQKGLAVILDVVYNHIGPEGNYLSAFGPYFTTKYHTPWGNALNFDDKWCNGPRDFFIENALLWLRDFHIDALRLDAVHAIKDFSAVHLLEEMRQQVDELSRQTGKRYHLIAELDLNDPKFIDPLDKGGFGGDAQWIDEFHHSLRVTAGHLPEGYYSDFSGITDLVKSYNDAYVYDGQFSEHRKKFFGTKTINPGSQFVVFSQNHDQTGNRMLGERTSTLVTFEMLKLMAGAVLVSPYLPMLFMGEEWGETNPFQFFISHTDKELVDLVRKGRKEEFSYFNWTEEPPDPYLDKTFHRSMLQWNLIQEEPHRTLLNYYRTMIALRKSAPALRHPDRTRTKAAADEKTKVLTLNRWHEQQRLLCLMNFSAAQQEVTTDQSLKTKLVDSAAPEWRGPGAAPDTAEHTVTLQPESMIIYEIA